MTNTRMLGFLSESSSSTIETICVWWSTMSRVGAKNRNLKKVFRIYCTISSSSCFDPSKSCNSFIR